MNLRLRNEGRGEHSLAFRKSDICRNCRKTPVMSSIVCNIKTIDLKKNSGKVMGKSYL